jgi:hypothetical protein
MKCYLNIAHQLPLTRRLLPKTAASATSKTRTTTKIKGYSLNDPALQLFYNKPFWIDDIIQHEVEFDRTGHRCCFNHIVGLPEKNGLPKAIFDYEWEIYKYLKVYKNLWVKKSRGLGLTEFFLRYLTWLCVFDNHWSGWRACIITGPRVELAQEEILRIKGLLQPKFTIFHNDRDTAVINNVTIQAFPSNAISIRGYDKVFWIMLDEADFFRPSEQKEARAAAEGYRLKSSPWIIMVSTPNRRGGIYETIEKTEESEHGYKKLEYLYQRGLNRIYDPGEIEQESKKGYFKREYCGLYDYDTGNFLPLATLELIENNGRKLLDFDTVNYGTRKSLGIDIGYGSSRTAFVITEKIDGYIRVIYAQQFNRPVSEEMINLATNLIFHYQLNRYGNQVYVDAANPAFIRSLKIAIGESQTFEQEIAEMKRDNKYWIPEGTMTVIPIPFGIKGEPMLEKLKELSDKGLLAINPEQFEDLMSDLRTARVEGRKLLKDKSSNQTWDLFDALRLSTEYYDLDTTKK